MTAYVIRNRALATLLGVGLAAVALGVGFCLVLWFTGEVTK